MNPRAQKLQAVLDWKASKPKDDNQWKKDIKKESLHIRTAKELTEMEESHEAKLPRVRKDLDKFENWPDVVRYELTERFTAEGLTGQALIDAVEKEFEEQHIMYKWKVAKLEQSIERIKKAKTLK